MPECIQALIAGIKDIAVIVAAVTGTWVAVRGLQAWREQMVGTSRFQAARNLMKAAYRTRMALQSFRTPWYPHEEYLAAKKVAPDDVAEFEGYIFHERWKAVEATEAELDEALLEAEALWGPKIRALGDQLLDCRYELRACLMDHLTYVSSAKDYPEPEDVFHAMFGEMPGMDPNSFTLKLTGALGDLEDFARPHLGRGVN